MKESPPGVQSEADGFGYRPPRLPSALGGAPRPRGGSLLTDFELVRRCLDGDAGSWSALLARYSDLVHSLLRRAGLDSATAEDAFQQVAVLLWRSLPRLRNLDRLASWFGTTSRRVAWRLSKQARDRARHEARAARDDASAVDDRAATLEEEQSLREALASLGARCRELLSLLYFQSADLTYDEIAQRLGMARGSLGPTRRRCMDALRTELLARGVAPDVPETASRASAPATKTPRRPTR